MKLAGGISVFFLVIVSLLLSFAGWITNPIYAFQHFNAAWSVEVVASFVGIVLAPMESLHGI